MLRMDYETLGKAINQAIGAELRGLRAKRGMSREDLKAATGMGISTIQRFENGERSPELPQLVRLLKALDMPVSEFLDAALRNVEGMK